MIALTAIGAVCLVVAVFHVLRVRRAMKGPERDRMTHELQKYREGRGF
jgi:hypothetical protein